MHFPVMSRFRLGFARALTLVGAIIFWTWTSAKAAVTLIGASTVGDDFEQLLERLPQWANWLFSTPWWVPTLFAGILTGFLIWLSWPNNSAQTIAAKRPVREPESLNAPETKSKSIIGRAFVGGPDGAGDIRLQFANTFSNVDLYLEFSIYNAYTIGSNGWLPPERIFLASIGKVSKNQIRGTSFLHIGKFANDAVFFLGQRNALENMHQAHVMRDRGLWRCRIVASANDSAEEYVYFIIIKNQKSENPTIIGQNIFEHIVGWEGGSKTYGDVFDLYKSDFEIEVQIQ
ncbi:hypothetical protein [Methylobacterium sp. CM6247]